MRCGHGCGVWRDTTCSGAMLVGIQCVYDVCFGLFVLMSWVLNWRDYDDLLPPFLELSMKLYYVPRQEAAIYRSCSRVVLPTPYHHPS